MTNDNERIALHSGDNRDVLRGIADNSIDSVVTDPPYALVSIVKRFGGNNAAPAKGNAAYMRASAGFMGKQWDNGEAAHDVEFWKEIYRVLKPGGHLLTFGGTRTNHRQVSAVEDAGFEIRDQLAWLYGTGFPKSHDVGKKSDEWQGWGTALKPALEPICLARKPLSEKTVAANVLRWGTGAINVDGCRVATDPNDPNHRNPLDNDSGKKSMFGIGGVGQTLSLGRFPANILHDGSDEVIAAFPVSSTTGRRSDKSKAAVVEGTQWLMNNHKSVEHTDSGSAARFFYSAKANKKDRADSKHPTVKPVALMRYLCRLITPPGGTVLDPFAGSGTTGEAALLEGFNAILIEREDEYVADIAHRKQLLGV